MTLIDAARCLKRNELNVYYTLLEHSLAYVETQNQLYFGHNTAKKLFNFRFTPQTVVFQIVKGGTGKTTLVYETAIRASLYGARVLCVDMDQQGNLTHAFNQNAETLPVMMDILVDHYPIQDAIVRVSNGIHLLPSRFENALLDEVLRMKKLPLDSVYRELLATIKANYDIILMDCPPSVGQSVAAAALAGDYVIAPVTADKFARVGLNIIHRTLEELENTFNKKIPLKILMNKMDMRTNLSREIIKDLFQQDCFKDKVFNHFIRLSQEFPNAIARQGSIFEGVKPNSAKEDIDILTQNILNIGPYVASYRPIFDSALAGELSGEHG